MLPDNENSQDHNLIAMLAANLAAGKCAQLTIDEIKNDSEKAVHELTDEFLALNNLLAGDKSSQVAAHLHSIISLLQFQDRNAQMMQDISDMFTIQHYHLEEILKSYQYELATAETKSKIRDRLNTFYQVLRIGKVKKLFNRALQQPPLNLEPVRENKNDATPLKIKTVELF